MRPLKGPPSKNLDGDIDWYFFAGKARLTASFSACWPA